MRDTPSEPTGYAARICPSSLFAKKLYQAKAFFFLSPLGATLRIDSTQDQPEFGRRRLSTSLTEANSSVG
jgi:hypothetical protein